VNRSDPFIVNRLRSTCLKIQGFAQFRAGGKPRRLRTHRKPRFFGFFQRHLLQAWSRPP